MSETESVSGMYGRPTAAELVAAVAEFLDGEVRSTTTGAVNFHALVAANALRIVERELLDAAADHPRAALAALGYADEDALAAAIRAAEAAATVASRRATKAKKRAADIVFLFTSAA